MRAPPSLGMTRADGAELLDDAGEHQPRPCRCGLVVEADVGADPGDVDQAPAGRVGDAVGAGEVERGAAVAPEHGGRHVGDEAVGEPGLDQRARERGAALDQRLEHPEAGEHLEGGGEVDPGAGGGGRDGEHLGARAEPGLLRGVGRGVGGDHERGRERGVEQRAVGRHPPGGVEQDPQRLAAHRGLHVAGGEARAVGERGAGADHHGLRVGAQRVRVGPGRRAGDPLRRAVARGDAAVEAHRGLDHGEGAAEAAVEEVGRERRGRRRRRRRRRRR